MTSTGTIAGASISYTRATVDQLEAAAAPSQREAVLDLLDAGAEEAFVLQTCNRVEGYVVADTAEDGQAALDRLVGDTPEELVVRMDHTGSLRHLLRVAAGLESLVVGEDQILGQVRDAYEDARGVGGIDTILEDGVTKATRVGERARTETAINEGVVSLASAAAHLAAENIALGTATGLVVGAGEIGTLAAETLAGRVEKLVVANRTVPHAEHVAEQVDTDAAGAVGLDDLPEAVDEADLVVT
ncbi:MAG: glutamyl-tRNA reductase, partial [Salinirussus sp.]